MLDFEGKLIKEKYNLSYKYPAIRNLNEYKNENIETLAEDSICDFICEEGHEWKQRLDIALFITKGKCPYCHNSSIKYENTLVYNHPDIAMDFVKVKNNGAKHVYDVTIGSNLEVIWQCKKSPFHVLNFNDDKCDKEIDGFKYPSAIDIPWNFLNNMKFLSKFGAHLYSMSPKDRIRGRGTKCHQCETNKNNLVSFSPKLAKEFVEIKNKIKAINVLPYSNKKYIWKCSKCNNEWEASVSNRTHGSGCPYCSGHKTNFKKSLPILYPELMKQWDYEKNKEINPYEISPKSSIEVWWMKDGKSKKSKVYVKTRGIDKKIEKQTKKEPTDTIKT